MSDAKHTPGPWSLSDHKRFVRYHQIDIAVIEKQPSSIEWEANAKLIAAAPDMYEIVKELYDWAQATQRFGPIYPKIEAVMNRIIK